MVGAGNVLNLEGLVASILLRNDQGGPGVESSVTCDVGGDTAFQGTVTAVLGNGSLLSSDGRSSVHFSPSILSDMGEWAAPFLCI